MKNGTKVACGKEKKNLGFEHIFICGEIVGCRLTEAPGGTGVVWLITEVCPGNVLKRVCYPVGVFFIVKYYHKKGCH